MYEYRKVESKVNGFLSKKASFTVVTRCNKNGAFRMAVSAAQFA
jgi:hypothetical protein